MTHDLGRGSDDPSVLVRFASIDVAACSRADARLLLSPCTPRSLVIDLREVALGPGSLEFLDELLRRARALDIRLLFVHAGAALVLLRPSLGACAGRHVPRRQRSGSRSVHDARTSPCVRGRRPRSGP